MGTITIYEKNAPAAQPIAFRERKFWGGIGNLIAGIYHWFKSEKKCNGNYYNPKTKFCVDGKTIDKCGGQDYNPKTEYCDNEEKCEKTCSAGVIHAAPVPINGEVILPIGGTAALSVSGANGKSLQWSASGGQLKVLSDTKATITSANPGKITVTFGSKTCSKCRTSITIAFVKVLKISADPFSIKVGETIKFTITTEPVAYVCLNSVIF